MTATILNPSDGEPSITTIDELNDVIAQANGLAANSGAYQIVLASSASIALTSELSLINLQAGVTLTIEGNGATLDGRGNQHGLVVYSGQVTIADLTIEHAVVHGSDGRGGGGGGAGLGGGLFVANDVANGAATAGQVTLSNVTFSNDGAVGGSGSTTGGTTIGGTLDSFAGPPNNFGVFGFGAGSGDGPSSEAGFGGGGAFETVSTGGDGGGANAPGGFGSSPGIGPTGGGGLGAGGDIFVQDGASLTISGGSMLLAGNVAGGFSPGVPVEGGDGGAGSGGLPDGAAYGDAIFIGNGAISLGTGQTAGQITTIAGSIADVVGSADPHGGTDTGGVDISGFGTVVLGGVNTYTGGTTVEGGTLEVTGSIANSAVTVQSGGTLGGSGTTGAVTVEAGGTFAPGDPTTITVASLTLNSGAHFGEAIGGTNPGTGGADGYDQTIVQSGGTVSLGGAALDLSLVNDFTPAVGESFEIIDNRGTDAVSGQFAQGTAFIFGDREYAINYAGGDGNDVVLTTTEVEVATVSGSAFTDANGNGVRDAGEAALAGITVHLTGTDKLGEAVSVTTTTDASGNYNFGGIADGTYSVAFGNSDGTTTYIHTLQDQGGDDTVDSDANVTTGATASFVVDSSHQNILHEDAGYYSSVSIGDFVFDDLNANGRQDAGEPGVAGVTVSVTNTSLNFTFTTTTDANGFYNVSNLPPGSYTVTFNAPAGYVFTSKDSPAATDATDSDADPATGVTDSFAVTSGHNVVSIDAGMYAPPVISGLNGDTTTFTEGGPPVLLDNPASPAIVTDADSANFGGGNLTATITNVVAGEDVVGIATDSTVTLSNNTSVGSEVRVDGGSGLVLIGTIASGGTGSGGEPLVVTFNGAATPDLVSILTQHLVYSDLNQGDIDATTRSINVSIVDGGGVTSSATVTVNVVGVNDEPTLTATAVNPTFTEGGAAADIFTTPIAASTVEAGQSFSGMTVTIANVADGASEIFTFDGSQIQLSGAGSLFTAGHNIPLVVDFDGTSTFTLHFSGANLTAATLQSLIDGFAYNNTSQDPTAGDRVVTITEVVDSGSNVSPDVNTAPLDIVSTVHVQAVDDAPVLTGFGDTPAFVERGAPVILDANGNATDS